MQPTQKSNVLFYGGFHWRLIISFISYVFLISSGHIRLLDDPDTTLGGMIFVPIVLVIMTTVAQIGTAVAVGHIPINNPIVLSLIYVVVSLVAAFAPLQTLHLVKLITWQAGSLIFYFLLATAVVPFTVASAVLARLGWGKKKTS